MQTCHIATFASHNSHVAKKIMFSEKILILHSEFVIIGSQILL